MAAFDIDFPVDFMSELLDTDFEEIAKAALEETAPILENSMKQSCRRVIEHPGESELVDSIKSGKPKRTKTDAWIVNVSPRGYSKTKVFRAGKKKRKYPVSNALKLIWKEYGIAGQQAAKPFLTNACNSVRDTIMSKMQEIYEQKVGMK